MGGDSTFLAGRLVTWLEIGLISWCWVRLARRLTGRPHGTPVTVLAVVAAFAFTASAFPIMPWHTIDALALTAAGLLLSTSRSSAVSLAGCGLLGASILCRQNFLPLGLVVLAILPAHRRVWGAIAWLIPPALYMLALAALGALPVALQQMRSQTGLIEPGFVRYATTPHTLLGVLLGTCVGIASRREANRAVLAVVAWLATPVLLGWAAWTMSQRAGPFLWQASFAMFGTSLGLVLSGLSWRRPISDEARFGAIVLAVAWCTSISIGMNTPALAAGGLAVFMLVAGTPTMSRTGPNWRAQAVVSLLTLAAITFLWVHARRDRIYRDRPAANLSASLDGVLAGGRGLVTNPNTAELMVDLRSAIELARGRPVAIVVDFPAYWVRSAGRNPLSIDWPQGIELNRPELRARVIDDLERLRGRGVIIVQKHDTATAPRGFQPTADSDDYFLIAHVRDRFRRMGGTAHFDLYK